MLVPAFFQVFYYQTWHRNATRGNNNWSLKKWTIDKFFISILTGNTSLVDTMRSSASLLSYIFHQCGVQKLIVRQLWHLAIWHVKGWIFIFRPMLWIFVLCVQCVMFAINVCQFTLVLICSPKSKNKSCYPVHYHHGGADENIACFAHRFIRNWWCIKVSSSFKLWRQQ